jgi:uncharacterized membrane protein YeiH
MMYILEMIGVAAFAISGVMAGRSKRPDIIGAIILAFATALGGGIIRDAILGVRAQTFTDATYFYVIIISSVLAMLIPGQFDRFWKALLVFDAIGLGAFTAGTLAMLLAKNNTPFPFILVITGITACGGGIIRDVLLAEMPLILRREIYISASFVGAICAMVVYKFSASSEIIAFVAAFVTIAIRLVAVKFKWAYPVIRG